MRIKGWQKHIGEHLDATTINSRYRGKKYWEELINCLNYNCRQQRVHGEQFFTARDTLVVVFPLKSLGLIQICLHKAAIKELQSGNSKWNEAPIYFLATQKKYKSTKEKTKGGRLFSLQLKYSHSPFLTDSKAKLLVYHISAHEWFSSLLRGNTSGADILALISFSGILSCRVNTHFLTTRSFGTKLLRRLLLAFPE